METMSIDINTHRTFTIYKTNASVEIGFKVTKHLFVPAKELNEMTSPSK